MKFESLLLRGLFMICMVLCFGTIGSMLFAPSTHPAAVGQTQLASSQAGSKGATPAECPLPADGASCVRED